MKTKSKAIIKVVKSIKNTFLLRLASNFELTLSYTEYHALLNCEAELVERVKDKLVTEQDGSLTRTAVLKLKNPLNAYCTAYHQHTGVVIKVLEEFCSWASDDVASALRSHIGTMIRKFGKAA